MLHTRLGFDRRRWAVARPVPGHRIALLGGPVLSALPFGAACRPAC